MVVAARIGWSRSGSKRRFRYVDADGRAITDEQKLERIRALAIPPAWRDVWIARSANAKLQATGVDAAGRKQYLYHPAYRAKQEQEKYNRLIRFAERLARPRARRWRSTWSSMGLPEEKVAAIAVRLINHGWFRVGGERYARGVPHVRHHHTPERARDRARRPDFVSLPRQALDHGAKRRRRPRAGTGDAGSTRTQPGSRLFQFETARRRPIQPRSAPI